MKLFTRSQGGPQAPPTDEVVISIQGVTKQFGSHRVLEDITFNVPRGRTTAVLGPSGTGKSVLLKCIIGLLHPEAGQVFIDGEPLVGIPEKELLRIRRKFGVLFQDGALFGSMSLYDNIAFPMREHTKASEREIRTKVYEKAELVGLVAHLNKLPGEVSGGMKKRAGLARALVLEPEIIFFDEPDSGLDPVRVAYLDDLVNTAQAETHSTFFIITHNIESVMRTAHYMGLLFRSRLVKFASKEEIQTSKNPIVRQFFGGMAEGPISMDEMAESDVDFDIGEEEAAETPPQGGPAVSSGNGASGEGSEQRGRPPTISTSEPPTSPYPQVQGGGPPPPDGRLPWQPPQGGDRATGTPPGSEGAAGRPDGAMPPSGGSASPTDDGRPDPARG